MFEAILEELHYGIKLARGLLSGYDGLQHKTDDGWVYVEYTVKGKWDGTQDVVWDTPDYPYYVCPVWKNGSHTPLPFFTERGGGYIQRAILWICDRVHPRAYMDALQDCAYYCNEFERENPPVELRLS